MLGDSPGTSPRVAQSQFEAIGTTCRVLATDPATLDNAASMARHHLVELDVAASRFRPDSEVSRLAAKASAGPAEQLVSVLLADYLRAAIEMARLTDGLVDPTVGAAVVASGYDADMDEIRADPASRGGQGVEVPGFDKIAVSDSGVVHVPEGTILDLGATAKAHAADTIARRLGARLPGGFLVNLGGDIAVGGVIPPRGWHIGIQLHGNQVAQVIRSDGAAVCTSSTQRRTWTTAGIQRHHIVDPRTGATAEAVWASVTCVAPSAIVANAMATAAIVLGRQAPRWLADKGVNARLDGVDGSISYVNDWPRPAKEPA